MMHSDEFEGARKFLPKKLSDIIFYGHIGKDCFTEEDLTQLRIDYHELTYGLHYMFNPEWFDAPPEAMGLWGESSKHCGGTDLGLACVFFDGDTFVIPEHFMDRKKMAKFILDVAEEHYPQYLI